KESDEESIDEVESIPDTEFGEIPVDLIDTNPRQPRTVFDEDLLAELVHSIREIGVLQPVVVRKKPSDRSRFELIMGERRLRAAKDAGLSTIPAIIRYVDDTDLLRDALLENLHRAELNPLEEAAAYGQLLEDFGCTQEELSERIGRSRPQISNTLRLLRLPPLVQRRVAAGVISAGHARAILGLRDPEHMEVLAQRIVAEGLSVRASEEAVVLLNRGDSVNVSRATTKVSPEFLAVAERLGDRLDTKVNISVGKRKGKLSVEFANQEDLDRILGLLGFDDQDDIKDRATILCRRPTKGPGTAVVGPVLLAVELICHCLLSAAPKVGFEADSGPFPTLERSGIHVVCGDDVPRETLSCSPIFKFGLATPHRIAGY